ncbi:STAS domain-containing protein [Streptomyces sp. NPDC091272]|uniref:STAS domain-containing protein n=1 Tax=Streptomyces sp. NPDC091272 TaxID=3365981 RepID=UPI00380637FA
MFSDDRSDARCHIDDVAATVVLTGDFDLDNSHEASRAFDEASRTGLAVIADLGGVGFADSALLNLLLRLHHSHRLFIAGPLSAQLERLLTVTGVAPFLNLLPDLPAARTAAVATRP